MIRLNRSSKLSDWYEVSPLLLSKARISSMIFFQHAAHGYYVAVLVMPDASFRQKGLPKVEIGCDLAGYGKTFFSILRSVGSGVQSGLQLARKLHSLRPGQANGP